MKEKESSIKIEDFPELRHLAAVLKTAKKISDICMNEHDLPVHQWSAGEIEAREKRIVALHSKGLYVTPDGMSYYVNRISPACVLCKQGVGPTIPVTFKCNRSCFQCLQPRSLSEGGETSGKSLRPVGREFIEAIGNEDDGEDPLNLALSGGEPLLRKDYILEAISAARKHSRRQVITRLYTNGDMLSDDILSQLREAGLDEIRLGLHKPYGALLEKVTLCSGYIPRVIVEGAVFPEEESILKDLLVQLDRLGLYGINLLDLRCRYNLEAFRARNYVYAYKSNRAFYDFWDQGWPVYGSEEKIFNLLEFALDKKLKLSVHYCPVKQNNNVSQINLRRRQALRKNGCSGHMITDEGLIHRPLRLRSEYKKQALEIYVDCLPTGEIVAFDRQSIRLIRHREDVTAACSTGCPSIDPVAMGKFLASLYFRKRPDPGRLLGSVIKFIEDALQEFPASATFHYAACLIFTSHDLLSRALEHGKEVNKNCPGERDIITLLARIYDRGGDAEKALEILDDAGRAGIIPESPLAVLLQQRWAGHVEV